MSYDVIDPRTARTRQDEGWAYVDVRTPEEFAAGHPAGAVNVPILLQTGPNPQFVAGIRALFSPGAKLLMGCKSGGRSARACEVLAAGDYALANVDGGYEGSPYTRGWAAEGLPTATDGETWAAIRARIG